MNTSRAVLTRIVFLFFNRDMATECVRRALLLQGVKSGEKIPDVRESEEMHVKWPSLFDGFVEQMRTKQPDHQGVPCGEVCAFLPAAQPACTRVDGRGMRRVGPGRGRVGGGLGGLAGRYARFQRAWHTRLEGYVPSAALCAPNL